MDFIEYLDYEDVRENIILNRLHFYERKQTSGETFNAYVVELLELAKKCMFDEQEEWLVRDRIIFGSLYTDLNMYLLNLGGNPSLEEIVKAYRLHEKIQADTIDDSETRATEDTTDTYTLSDVNVKEEWIEEYDDAESDYDLASNSKLVDLSVEHFDLAVEDFDHTYEQPMKISVHDERYHKISIDDKMICKLCNQSVILVNFNAHLKIHLADNKFECVECNEHFDSLSDLKQHLDLQSHGYCESEQIKIVCTICGKLFKKDVYLKRHMLLHEVESTKCYECYICKKQLKTFTALETHLNYHNIPKSIACDKCGKTFRNKHILEIHQRIHSGERPVQCPVCHRRFRRLGDLKSHAIRHTNYKPFKCDLCDKSFGIKYQLKVHHMAVHRDERPFACDCCKKSFRSKSHLNGHMLIHTGEHPFKCSICSKAYRKNSNLKTHIKRHHGQTALL